MKIGKYRFFEFEEYYFYIYKQDNPATLVVQNYLRIDLQPKFPQKFKIHKIRNGYFFSLSISWFNKYEFEFESNKRPFIRKASKKIQFTKL